MLKKFFALILISSIFNSNAFIDEHLAQLKNPEQKYFEKLDLSRINFGYSSLTNRVFYKVKFHKSIFSVADLSNSIFIECCFEKASFSYDTTLQNTVFRQCNMNKLCWFSSEFGINGFQEIKTAFDQKSLEGMIIL